ncbi:MAG: tripartite tricarboxylate transporter substrate binding protein [Burkholderiales bacterium]
MNVIRMIAIGWAQAAMAGIVFGAGAASAQQWKPERNVEIVVNSGAGGAADRQARFVMKALQALPGMPTMTAVNRVGGGGIVALTFITQHPGDAHYLSTLSTGIVTNNLVGTTKLSFRDVTPLNILMREYVTATVRADSPIANAQDLLARLKKDPTSVSFGFATARGNQNHIVIGMIARAAGVDPKGLKTVVFASGAAGLTAGLGWHVDMLVGTPGTALPQAAAGKARVVAVSAPARQPGKLAGVPTFREQGIDAVYYAWRGFLAPRDLTPAQIAFWEQAFSTIAQGESWKKDLEANAWADDLRASAETRKHLEAEQELLGRMLVELGVISR